MIENLNHKQRKKTYSQKTSIFSAWMRNNYGSKRFVMAILETGLSWATTSGATEHSGSASDANDHNIGMVDDQQTITKFIDWILQVVKAIDIDKNKAQWKSWWNKWSENDASDRKWKSRRSLTWTPSQQWHDNQEWNEWQD